jgi:hypothetical protein
MAAEMTGYSNEAYTTYGNQPPAQFVERLYDPEEVGRLQTAKKRRSTVPRSIAFVSNSAGKERAT